MHQSEGNRKFLQEAWDDIRKNRKDLLEVAKDVDQEVSDRQALETRVLELEATVLHQSERTTELLKRLEALEVRLRKSRVWLRD